MAVLAFGLAGSAIGGAIGGSFLGMSAASIGWMVGSAIGSSLSQKDTNSQGPRLGDLYVQASTYGGMVPLVRGTMRVAGNVIWSTKKREVATTTRVGGKGGGSSTQTTYTYNVDIGIALCEGPMGAIRKIWSNGRLIYDASALATPSSVFASETNSVAFRFYPGSETQMPDPAYEALVGAGMAPAFRGTCHVVFEQLECPNGQIPQLHFELVSHATTADRLMNLSDLMEPAHAPTMYVLAREDRAWQWYQGSGNVYVGSGGGTQRAGYAQFPNNFWYRSAYPLSGGGAPRVGRIVSYDGFASVVIQVLNIETAELTEYGPVPNGDGEDFSFATYLGFDVVTGNVVSQAPGANPYPLIVSKDGPIRLDALPSGTSGASKYGIAIYDGVVYALVEDAAVLKLVKYNRLGQIDTITDVYAGAYSDAIVQADARGVWVYVTDFSSGIGRIYRMGAAAQLVSDAAGAAFTNVTPAVWVNDTCAVVGPGGGNAANLLQLHAVSAIDVPLADVLFDYCLRAGLDASQVDVSGVVGVVPGTSIARIGNARSALQPLMAAWFVDAVETDGVIRFTHRSDRVPVASIPYADLAAGVDGPQSEAAALARTQEVELPRSLALNFMNLDADYQPGTETARRQITDSINDQSMDLPIATTADHIATVAAGLLYNLWSERNRRNVSLTRKYAALDACDVVEIEYPQGVWSDQRIVSAQDDGGTISLGLVAADLGVLLGTAKGASPPGAQPGVSASAPTQLALLDIAPLRDADDDAGLYAAISPLGSPWSGATLFSGFDADTLLALGSVTMGAPSGFATSVLGTWNLLMMDEANTVDVQMNSGTVLGTSRDDLLDRGANLALLGEEIIQFRVAEALGDGAYRLSGLLRGVRGTGHRVGSHLVGERFVLLNQGGILRAPLSVSDIGTAMQWRGVSFGQALNRSSLVEQASTGQAVMPFAPVDARITRTAADIEITWDRVTRGLQGFPANGVDIPLFEASEAYEVDVFDGPTFTAVKRTLSAATAAAAYSAALQTVDFGSTQAVVYVRIHQLGRAGRGHYLQATL
jgi:hypothetical protein